MLPVQAHVILQMKNTFLALLAVAFLQTLSAQSVKILFDATKAETAGSADWIIDADSHNLGYPSSKGGVATVNAGTQSNAQRIPSPDQSNITSTTAETYWLGALSNWGIDCVKRGYNVETLPYNGAITYGNAANAQDLSHYKVFIVCEPNIQFTTAEKAAMLNFVQNGGGLFMISDHNVSDRNNDGWDSPAIWNDFLSNNGIKGNPFGISFDLQNFSTTSSNVSGNTTDSLLHGPMGSVSKVMWSAGTSMTLSTSANPTVTPVVCKTGAFGNTNVMVAYARYGSGKVVAIGDSSPCDDGTGDPGDQLYNGYTGDASGNHQKLLMNATIWLATDNTIMPVKLTGFNVTKVNNEVVISWRNLTESNVKEYDLLESTDGKQFALRTTVSPKGNNGNEESYRFAESINRSSIVKYYRLKVVELDNKVTYSDIKRVSLKGSRFSLAANPVSDFATVQLSGDVTQPVTIAIMSEAGEKIYSTSTLSGASSINLPCANLAQGIYFVQAEFNGERETIKLVKK